MDNLINELRRFYYLTSIPTLAFFLIAYLTADVPLVDDNTRYLMLVTLYVVALVLVPVSSYKMRGAIIKGIDMSEEERVPKLRKAYKIRLWSLNAISYLVSPFYFITVEESSVYLFAILTVVTLLSFPTKQYLTHNQAAN